MKNLNYFLTLLATLSLSACNSNLLDPALSGSNDGGSGVAHGMIVLGERLEDPYSVENMTKALKSLYPTKASIVELEATDHYVRLLPRDYKDIQALEAMGVKMLDHPMDYKILQEGDYYHDPQIEENSITWQYAVVPPDFEAPQGIECELLHKCYLAEAENNTKAELQDVDWEEVEREAFRLSGNEDMLMPRTKGGEPKTPKGRISIIDKDYSESPIGVSGVQVSCNVFVKFDRCYTDENGYYEMRKSFTSKPRYRLVFTNSKGFTLGLNAIFVKGSMSTLGKQPADGYSICITEKSDDRLFLRCAMNNAAYDYYKACSSKGVKIKTPPSNLTIWSVNLMEASAAVMLHQGAILDLGPIESALGVYSPVVRLFMPDVILGTKNFDSYSKVYHLVQHELAHCSHYMQVGNSYWDNYAINILSSYLTSGGVTYGTGTEESAGYCEVGEMWAYYVENILYRQRYSDYDTTFGSKYWFHPEIFLYLDDRGMNRFQIFPALTKDVAGRENLRSRLIVLYPECKSIINEAFNKYL